MHEHLTNPLGFSQAENSGQPAHVAGAVGIDEAGRGCLAGPVVAAAVYLPDSPEILAELSGLTDSKQLSEKERLRFEALVKMRAAAWSLGFVWPEEIDRSDILRATFRAMSAALASMLAKSPHAGCTPPERILIDGNQILPAGILLDGLQRWNLAEKDVLPQQAVVKGDSKVLAIAAASVLAKVGRDRLMQHLDKKYPQYGFARHKGYGTREHLEAIKKHGVTPMHRQSFQGCRPEDLAPSKTGKPEVQNLLLPS